MRVPSSTCCPVIICLLLVLSSTCVSAFVPNGLGQAPICRPVLRRSTDACLYYRKFRDSSVRVCADEEVGMKKARGYALWNRLDTMEATGLTQSIVGPNHRNSTTRRNAPRHLLSSATTLGLGGHTGLLLVSTLIVNIIKAIFFTKPPTEEEELLASTGDAPPKQSGMMDRCPWPFIFFHDPKQGLKDSPTWVMVCWYCLYRLWKYRVAATVV